MGSVDAGSSCSSNAAFFVAIRVLSPFRALSLGSLSVVLHSGRGEATVFGRVNEMNLEINGLI
eukprot:scaffold75450_cov49-Attheya_sp.AAC.2